MHLRVIKYYQLNTSATAEYSCRQPFTFQKSIISSQFIDNLSRSIISFHYSLYTMNIAIVVH
ncbi:hypothetical protein T4D_5064 [Trichinella pseudospiralis]|uniref:Uncharacterized protein n=1 Tax=Trichinella pseudospiralis TaxID=6337 RepID=A0A0V1FC68_TRIPS|nr:hypothetical protein T4D_5064 [Trichinella pseudospiralis]